jgi:hypothetical protein
MWKKIFVAFFEISFIRVKTCKCKRKLQLTDSSSATQNLHKHTHHTYLYQTLIYSLPLSLSFSFSPFSLSLHISLLFFFFPYSSFHSSLSIFSHSHSLFLSLFLHSILFIYLSSVNYHTYSLTHLLTQALINTQINKTHRENKLQTHLRINVYAVAHLHHKCPCLKGGTDVATTLASEFFKTNEFKWTSMKEN